MCFERIAIAMIGVVGFGAPDAVAVEEQGSYRVERNRGVWWFVEPDGERFVSLGVNCVLPGANREKYDPAKPAYAAFRHYDSTEHWADDAVGRLKSWRFNTVGGWSDPAVLRGQMPYIKVLHLGAQLGVPWNDLFADEFALQAKEFAAASVSPLRDDPNLLGWCTDNELGWYPDSIFLFHMAQPTESKTRQRLVTLLRRRYDDDFSALERDFQSPDAQSFDELERGGRLQSVPGGAARRVILEFTELLAEQYYRVTSEAIRQADPNHLILGDRYISFCPDAVVRAAGPYVDVVTTNYDWPAGTDGYLPPHYLQRLHELSGRPVLVTEFYVAATENRSGNPNSGNIFTTVPTQRERAAAVANRLRQLVQLPFVVGAHWFCFADEPPGGRVSDGEDYNFGLVDIENRPYELLTAAFTDVNGRAADWHAESGQTISAPSKSPPARSIPRAGAIPLAGIADWEKSGHVPPQPLGSCASDLISCWDDRHVYVAVLGLRFVDRQLYPTDGLPPSELLQLTLNPAGPRKPICLQFGVGHDVAVDGEAIDCRAWQDGVRYTAIAALPAAMFGKQRLGAGDVVELRATLRDPRDDSDTQWHTTLQLD